MIIWGTNVFWSQQASTRECCEIMSSMIAWAYLAIKILIGWPQSVWGRLQPTPRIQILLSACRDAKKLTVVCLSCIWIARLPRWLIRKFYRTRIRRKTSCLCDRLLWSIHVGLLPIKPMHCILCSSCWVHTSVSHQTFILYCPPLQSIRPSTDAELPYIITLKATHLHLSFLFYLKCNSCRS